MLTKLSLVNISVYEIILVSVSVSVFKLSLVNISVYELCLVSVSVYKRTTCLIQ
jgi:hypothetical protein